MEGLERKQPKIEKKMKDFLKSGPEEIYSDNISQSKQLRRK